MSTREARIRVKNALSHLHMVHDYVNRGRNGGPVGAQDALTWIKQAAVEAERQLEHALQELQL